MRGFIRTSHVLIGDIATVSLEKALHFIMGYLGAMETRVTLF